MAASTPYGVARTSNGISQSSGRRQKRIFAPRSGDV
jgi:hypothetical protein